MEQQQEVYFPEWFSVLLLLSWFVPRARNPLSTEYFFALSSLLLKLKKPRIFDRFVTFAFTGTIRLLRVKEASFLWQVQNFVPHVLKMTLSRRDQNQILKTIFYRVSQKSVYVFSNLNISTIINAINLICLCIVDLTFISLHIKFEWNRPCHLEK